MIGPATNAKRHWLFRCVRYHQADIYGGGKNSDMGGGGAVRLSGDDSQHDLGLDAGQPVFAVLQRQGIQIDATDARLAS